MGGPAGPAEEPEEARLTALLLDEMYPPSLAQKLRDLHHNAVAVLEIEVGLASRSDEEVLAWAARTNRCVVTENVRDFARLAAQDFRHSGIIFVNSRRFPRTLAGLDRIAAAIHHLLVAGTAPGPDGVIWLAPPP